MERQWSNWTYFQKLWWWIATVFCGFGTRSKVGSALYEVGVPGWFPGTRWELYIDTGAPIMPTSVVNRDNSVNEDEYSLPSGQQRWQFSQEKLLKLMVLERQKLDLEMEIKGEKLKGSGAKLRKLEEKLEDTLRELEETMEETEEAKEAEEEADGKSPATAAEADGESQVSGEAMEIS